MKIDRKTVIGALGGVIGVLLYALVLLVGAAVAVAFVTGLAVHFDVPFIDAAAVLAVALYGMSLANNTLGAALAWLGEVMLRRMSRRLRDILGQDATGLDDEATAERVPVWMDRPPCEGRYLVQHPDGTLEHGVQVKRYLPRLGLWAILSSGLTQVDDLVEQGCKFDGPLSRAAGT